MKKQKDVKLSKLIVSIDPDLHRNFKIRCIEKGVPMRRVVEELIRKWLK